MTVRQKLGMILENKVFQNLKLSKNKQTQDILLKNQFFLLKKLFSLSIGQKSIKEIPQPKFGNTYIILKR